jgi:hypothetical protein
MVSLEMDFGLQRQSIHFRRHFKKDRLLKLIDKGPPLKKLTIFRGRPLKRLFKKIGPKPKKHITRFAYIYQT